VKVANRPLPPSENEGPVPIFTEVGISRQPLNTSSKDTAPKNAVDLY
jgi:hypothetical protein